MGVTSGITHLVESILETIRGAFVGIIHLFEFILNSIVGVFRGFVDFVEGTLGFAFRESFSTYFGLLQTRGMSGKLTSSSPDNFFILGTLAAVVLGYMLYTQRTGTAPVSRAVKN
ncbi:hypothetical protein CHU98_g7202 [Xylaria longipes]|nr:hypothetical protein CHU98_g7202 [Xylaria longipes]